MSFSYWVCILNALWAVVAPVSGQYWNAEDFWNQRYGSKGISYDQVDRENGLWSDNANLADPYLLDSDTYTPGGTGFCGGCSCDQDNFNISSCSGTVTLVQISFYKINPFTFDASTRSIEILNCPDFNETEDHSFDHLVNLEKLIIQKTGLSTIPDVSQATALKILNLADNAIQMTSLNYKGNWALPSSLTHLALMHNQMYWIPPGWLSGANLRIASFSYNQFTQLQGNVFGDVSSLVYLGMDGNQIKRLSVSNLQTLSAAPNFVHLNISNNEISYIGPRTFNQLNELRILEIHQNSLASIASDVFHDITNLLHLDLNNNDLTEIKTDSFVNLVNLTEFRLHSQKTGLTKIAYDGWKNISPELKYLFVSDNELTTFPHQVLSEEDYPKLEVIWADRNSIQNATEFGSEAFSVSQRQLYNTKLQTFTPFSTYPILWALELSYNLLTEVRNTDFCNLTSLTNLYLRYNSITENKMDVDAFACTPILRLLHLEGNNIQYVPEAVRSNSSLPAIQELYLGTNQITFVETETFSSLTTLITLALANNRILIVEDGAFPAQLQILYMCCNDFRFLTKNPFTNLVSLSHLDLNSNEIDFIPPDAFTNCTSLATLYLHSNNIPQILDSHFADCPLTGYLYLQNNDIGWIEDGAFAHFTSMISLSLANNKLTNLPNGGDFNNLSISQHLDLSGNRIVSLPSGVFSSLSTGWDLHLQNNKIASIKSGAFSDVSVRHLYLGGNPLRELNTNSFSSVSLSEALRLDSLSFTEIPTRTFNSVSAKSIQLQGGQVSTIGSQAFFDVSVTEDLNIGSSAVTVVDGPIFGGTSSVSGTFSLQSNSLTGMAVDAFENVTINFVNLANNNLTVYPSALTSLSVNRIYLENNQITAIPSSAFSGQTGLQQLFLSNNLLTQIDASLFNDLTGLQQLWLNGNELEEIDSGSFDTMGSLIRLYLQDNHLTHFNTMGNLNNLQTIDLSNNDIETVGTSAFSSLSNLQDLDLTGNPLGCECELVAALDAVSSAITAGTCSFPSATNGTLFASSQSKNSMYYQKADLTLFQCAAENVAATAVSGTEIQVTWEQPTTLHVELNGTSNSSFSGPWKYIVTCISTTAATVTTTKTDGGATVQTNINTGILAGTKYECSIQLEANGYTSAKSAPAFVTTPDSSSTNGTTAGLADIELSVTYYDFSKTHGDFDGLSYPTLPSPSYIPSPYGAWPAISSTPTTDTFSDWFRDVSGTNQVFTDTVILVDQSGSSNRYWSDAFFPVDGKGYQAELQTDCLGTLHNFGFTSAIRVGLKFGGSEVITVGGGEALWLFINTQLVIENVETSYVASVDCYQIDLSPAAATGGGTITPMKGIVSGGACSGLSALTSAAVTMELEVGEIYHFDLFHAEYVGCSSSFFMDVQNTEFTAAYTGTTSSSSAAAAEQPLDYSVTVAEDFNVNGIVETLYLTDVFSTGPTFAVTIIKGNEGRHFTLKDDTTANRAAGVATPVTPTYTSIAGSSVDYVSCATSTPGTELNDTSTEAFTLTTTTALLTLATDLDYELVTSYYLVMQVVDSGASLTGSVAIRIKISDVNDNCPQLDQTSFTLTPVPVLTTTPLFTINATDADSADNGDIYFVVSSVILNPPRDYNSSMDLEKEVYNISTTLTFEVVAVDKGSPTHGTSASVSVTLSNTCLVDVEFHDIDFFFIPDNSTGDVYLKIPKYWVYEFPCQDLIGVSSGLVRDNLLTASSSYNDSTTAIRGRLNITANYYSALSGGWVAGTDDQNQYIQVDMESAYKYTQVHIQGQEEEDQWVTSFKVLYADSDAGPWTTYSNGSGYDIFLGNVDRASITTVDLDPPILSRYIRLQPWTWYNGIALRMEFSGCTQAEQYYYDTSCERCYTGYFCEGDGVAHPCGRCDPPQANSTCGRSPTEHSFGIASECSPCPDGWLCQDGIASICDDFTYIMCNDTYCPSSCLPCETGYACYNGRRTLCEPGAYSDGQMEFCTACLPGTYQDLSGQSGCKNCPAGYFSSARMDRCERCPVDSYAMGDGTGCVACTSVADCPCMTGDKCFGTGCNNLENGNYNCDPCPTGYTGSGVTCTDIDECSVHDPCFNSRCYNTEPGYQCLACPLGYTGTFEDAYAWNVTLRVFELTNNVLADIQVQTCIDIDECATNNGGCDVNMECVNTPGSYYCGFCGDGYLGNTLTGCYLSNFCVSGAHNCGTGAVCVYVGPAIYRCECADGYAGDGELCGLDSDQDGYPDAGLSCDAAACSRDNCVTTPNSGQEDTDNDQFGDTCDTDDDNDGIKDIYDNCQFVANVDQIDADNDGVGDACDNCIPQPNTDQLDTDEDGTGDACSIDDDGDGVADSSDNCPLVANAGQENTGDTDTVGDACDNCISVDNDAQTDTDQNGVGDACDVVGGTNKDEDGDGILDFLDNCPAVANGDQADNDGDGTGDLCDTDIDGDGVLNAVDNCPYLSNPSQEDLNGDTIGDACANDSDADGVVDKDDACPYVNTITTTSFRKYFTVDLDPSLTTTSPSWQVGASEEEIKQLASTAIPTMLIGEQSYGGIEYSGTWYVDSSTAEDYIGFVFSYVHNRKFYLVKWKHNHYNYGNTTYKAGIKGIQIKVVDSSTGPGTTMAEAIWHSYDTADEVTLIWQDSNLIGWQPQTSYRWHLKFQPSIGYINLKVYRGDTLLVNSGDLYDGTISGGRVGVFQFGQFPVIWSQLEVDCLTHENSGLYLDGTDAYVGLDNVTTLMMEESFTLEVWLKLDVVTGSIPVACTYSRSVCLSVEAGVVQGVHGGTTVTASTTLSADEWYNVILRYSLEDQTLTIFVDGTNVGDISSVPDMDWSSFTSINDNYLYLGRDETNYMKGTLDEVRIYGVAIPDTEIDSHIQLVTLERTVWKKYGNVHLKMEESAGATTLTNSGVLSISPQLFGGYSFVESLQDYKQFQLTYPLNR